MTAIKLRPAGKDDMHRVFAWINHPDALAERRRSSGPIALSDHQAWFDQALTDPDCRIDIIEDEGVAIGQVRLQGPSDAPEVSIFVVPEKRRAGVARKAIAEAIRLWLSDRPGARPRAWVRAGNRASLALFQSLGFAPSSEARGFVYLEQIASRRRHQG